MRISEVLFKVSLFLVLGQIAPRAAFSGNEEGREVGNGGGAIVCRDSSGKILFSQMYEVWEYGKGAPRLNNPNLHIIESDQVSAEELVERSVSRMDKLVPAFTSELRPFIELVKKEVQVWVNDPESYRVPRVFDSRHILQPSKCPDGGPGYPEYEQVINYFDDKSIQIDAEIFNKFSETSKAIAYLHEATYRLFRDPRVRGDIDSIQSRRLAAHLIAGIGGDALRTLLIEIFNAGTTRGKFSVRESARNSISAFHTFLKKELNNNAPGNLPAIRKAMTAKVVLYGETYSFSELLAESTASESGTLSPLHDLLQIGGIDGDLTRIKRDLVEGYFGEKLKHAISNAQTLGSIRRMLDQQIDIPELKVTLKVTSENIRSALGHIAACIDTKRCSTLGGLDYPGMSHDLGISIANLLISDERFIALLPNVADPLSEYQRTPLFEVVAIGDIELVRKVLAHPEYVVNARTLRSHGHYDYYGSTTLAYFGPRALERDCKKIVTPWDETQTSKDMKKLLESYGIRDFCKMLKEWAI